MNRLLQLAIRDLFAAMMMCFFLFVLLPHKKSEAEEAKAAVKSQGEMYFDIGWPYPDDVDIDLWVKNPMDKDAVGYSNKGSTNCNLLRDDTGSTVVSDPAPVNFERIICRKIADGEWIATVNYYGGPDKSKRNIPVDIIVTVVKDNTPTTLFVGRVVIEWCGAQHTAVRIIKTPDHGFQVLPGEANKLVLGNSCGGH